MADTSAINIVTAISHVYALLPVILLPALLGYRQAFRDRLVNNDLRSTRHRRGNRFNILPRGYP